MLQDDEQDTDAVERDVKKELKAVISVISTKEKEKYHKCNTNNILMPEKECIAAEQI